MRAFLTFLILLLLTACSNFSFPGGPTAQPTGAPATEPVRPSPGPTSTSTPTAGPPVLQIWLPPEFDPALDTPASSLLAARLDEYLERRPGVQLQVRVKAVEGPGGLLDALTTASAAAPLALPDLVALPRSELEVAALKGLLHPFDNLSQAIDSPDWYEYARQLARLQNSTFGLPFAGDALLLAYRPEQILTVPASLNDLHDLQSPLAFPAAGQEALFTLTQYLSAGGSVLDEQGRPNLDQEPLERVLAHYGQGATEQVFPAWLAQLAADGQAWDAFLEGRSHMVVTWTSRFLQSQPEDAQAARLPTLSGEAFTLADGWVWAMAGANAEHQSLAVELAEFLTDSRFLAQWTAAAGYLPPRPSALEPSPDAAPAETPTPRPSPTVGATPTPGEGEGAAEGELAEQPPAPDLPTILDSIALSARLVPSSDVLISLGPPLQEAVLGVLRQEISPAAAAQSAVNRLGSP